MCKCHSLSTFPALKPIVGFLNMHVVKYAETTFD